MSGYSYHFQPLTTKFSIIANQLSNFSRLTRTERSNQDVTVYVNGKIKFTNQADVFTKDLSEKLSNLKQCLISKDMDFADGRNEFMKIMQSAADMNFMYDTTFLFNHVDDELLRLLFENDRSSYHSFKQCTSVEFLHQKLQNNALYVESLDVDLEKVKEIFMRNISFFFNQPSLSQYLTTSEFIFQLFSLVYYFERATSECLSLIANSRQHLYPNDILNIALKMVNINCCDDVDICDDQNIIGQRTYFKQSLARNIFNIEIYASTNRNDGYKLTDKYSNLYAVALGFSEKPQLHVNYSMLYNPDGNVALINESIIPKLRNITKEISSLISNL